MGAFRQPVEDDFRHRALAGFTFAASFEINDIGQTLLLGGEPFQRIIGAAIL